MAAYLLFPTDIIMGILHLLGYIIWTLTYCSALWDFISALDNALLDMIHDCSQINSESTTKWLTVKFSLLCKKINKLCFGFSDELWPSMFVAQVVPMHMKSYVNENKTYLFSRWGCCFGGVCSIRVGKLMWHICLIFVNAYLTHCPSPPTPTLPHTEPCC